MEPELTAATAGDLIVPHGEEIQVPRKRVVDGDLLGPDVLEKEVASAALFDLPPREGVVAVRDAGEEDVGTANRGSVVRVRAAVDGRKCRHLGAVVVEKKTTRGGGWNARKRRRNAGEKRTALRKARQASVARMRLGKEGRRRKISQRSSSLRECIVVVEADTFCFFAGGDGCSGLEWEAMASGAAVAWFGFG
jgi:hypothetical protein